MYSSRDVKTIRYFNYSQQERASVLYKFIFVELPGSIGVHVDYPAKFGICVRIHEVHPCQVRVLVSMPGQEETQEGKEKRWKKV